MPLQHELNLFKAMPQDVEIQARRFDSYSSLLLKDVNAECTAAAWGSKNRFPLMTHGIFSCGTTSDKRAKAVGKTGSQILHFNVSTGTDCFPVDDELAKHATVDGTGEIKGRDHVGHAGPLDSRASIGNTGLGVMLKHDCTVMAERRAASVMQLMERLIHESPDMQNLLQRGNLTIADVKVTYHIVCLTPHDAMVEMVNEAVTLRAAKTHCKDRRAPQGPRSFREFLQDAALKRSPHVSAAQPWEIILPITCAISAVLSFVLHLGDRHDENVMVTPQGRYVHVDFGWQLGETPALQQALLAHPEVRVDYNDIWDAVGPEGMETYFYPAVFACFKTLRRHSHLLHEVIADLAAVVYQGSNASLSELIGDPAASYVSQRLLPGVLSEEQAVLFIEGVILRHRDQQGLQIYRELHKRVQDNTQSISASALALLSRPCRMCDDSRPILDLLYHGTCPSCAGTFCQRHLPCEAHQCNPSG
jgi:hypothetical protein